MDTGNKNYERKAYSDAENNFEAALEEVKQSEAPDTRLAIAYTKLGDLYKAQANELAPSVISNKKLLQASLQYKQALHIYETIWGLKDPTTISTLNSLLSVLSILGKHDEIKALVTKYDLPDNLRGDTFSRPLPEMLWNVWADLPDDSKDQAQLSFEPQAFLLPNSQYLLALDLSGISYGTNEQGVFARVVDEPFKKEVARWLETSKNFVNLEVIVIPDRNYFMKPEKSSQILKFRLDKLRKLRTGEGITVEGNPFVVMKKGGDPEFMFGRVIFPIQTAGTKGIGSIGLSLWVDGRPVEEVTVQLCIASDSTASVVCKDKRQLGFGLKGIDTVRIATESDGSEGRPAAALHFFSKDSDDFVIGLFRRNDVPNSAIITWRLQKKASDLYTYLGETQLSIFGTANKAQFRYHGDELYKLLFPPSDLDEEKTQARETFDEFVEMHMWDARPASIFVRMVDPGLDPPLLIPLGLMVVKEEFLGLHFRIDMPLKTQTYQSLPTCQSRWVIVLPAGGDDALAKVGEGIGPSVRQWYQQADHPFKTMIGFGEWIKMNGQDPATAIVITSHHDKDQLSLGSGDSITSASIVRRFSKPSLAILNGCGTAKPGAVDFIRKFNINGIDTVIGTNTQVDGKMAGQFLECFMAQLEDPKNLNNKTYTVSEAYFQALQCLSKQKSSEMDDAYGERVLAYSLFGNGNVRVCPPN